jgi:hypothetical protein
MSNKGLWIGPDFEHTDYLIIKFEQNDYQISKD